MTRGILKSKRKPVKNNSAGKTATMKNYLTKAQINELFTNWGVKVNPPTKGEKVTVAFPNEHLNVAEVTWSKHKCVDEKNRLYEVVMYHK